MKKFLWIFSSAMILSLAFLSTGCEDEGTVNDLAPVVSLDAGPTPDVVVAGAGEWVTVTVSATKGTNALKSVTVNEGAGKVAIDDLEIDGSAAAANPVLIVSPTDAMTWDISVKVTTDPGTTTYTVVVGDEGGLSDEVSFDVKVETAIESTIEGVDINLWNQAGPAGKGAIDLDNGASTGTNDATAELRDMGIDSLAGSGDNWRRRVGGINGTEVRFAGNINSGAEFSSVASKEAIQTIFDEAADLITASTITVDNLNVWGNFKVSDVVQEGDVFVVYKSSSETYYLVVVNSIVENTTLGDNTDRYNVSIKY